MYILITEDGKGDIFYGPFSDKDEALFYQDVKLGWTGKIIQLTEVDSSWKEAYKQDILNRNF